LTGSSQQSWPTPPHWQVPLAQTRPSTQWLSCGQQTLFSVPHGWQVPFWQNAIVESQVSSQQGSVGSPQATQVPLTQMATSVQNPPKGPLQQAWPVAPHPCWPAAGAGRWKAPTTAAATPPATTPSRPRRLCVGPVARRRVRRSKVSGVMRDPFGGGVGGARRGGDLAPAVGHACASAYALSGKAQGGTYSTASCRNGLGGGRSQATRWSRIALRYLWSTCQLAVACPRWMGGAP
jgi:hypothetical protein